MTKYHVNDAGQAGPCSAKFNCPFGDLTDDHYSTPKDAREAYELKMNEKLIEALQSRNREILNKPEEKVYAFKEEQLRETRFGRFENEGVVFSRDPDEYDDESWIGVIEDGAEDVKLDIRIRSREVVSFLDVGKETIEISREPFSFDHLPEGSYAEVERATALAKAVDVAKRDYPEHFDVERSKRLAKKASDYEKGVVVIGGNYMIRDGYVSPEIWEVKEPENIPGVEQYYIRVRHGVASFRVIDDESGSESLYSESLSEGDGRFGSDIEAARFFEKAQESLKAFAISKGLKQSTVSRWDDDEK